MVRQDQDGRPVPPERGAAAGRLVAAADLLTVALVLLALTIVLFKGFRFEVAGVRLSATDFGRPLILAGLLTLIRHAFVRRPTLRERLRQALARRHAPAGVSAVLWPFAVSRLAVLFTGLMAVYAIGFREAPPFRVSLDETLNLLARFDTGWYWSIAQHGYSSGGNLQHDVAFFPLYPLLMAGFGRVLGGDPMTAGLVVSLGAFLGALVYVYRLAAAWCEREDSPGAAVALLAFYPFAIFFGLVYTESVFLLCAAGAMYHVFRRDIVPGTIFAFAAGLTRPNGFLLALPLALLALSTSSRLQGNARRWLVGARLQHSPARAGTAWYVVPVVAPVAAMLTYSAYVAALTGAPFTWASAQEGWGREYSGLSALVTGPYARLQYRGILGAIRAWPFDTFNAMAGLFALVGLWPVTRRYGLALGVFVAVNLLPPMLVGGTVALGRYTSVLFPLFFWMADSLPSDRRQYWLGAFGVGQGLAACLFFTWRPLF